MDKNVIYKSHNINILELLYAILNKYDNSKENIIELSFDGDDIRYYSDYFLDGNNELTKSAEDFDPNNSSEGYQITSNRDFNLDIYVKTKYNYLVKILKTFDITCGDLKIEKQDAIFDIDTDGEEVLLENYKEIYNFTIQLNQNDLKMSTLENDLRLIDKRDFHYSLEKIEDAILREFENRGKNKIKISQETLGEILGYQNPKHYVVGTKDGIIIKYYNDVIELFLMKLYLDGKIESYEKVGDGLYSISKNELETTKAITINNTNNEIILLGGKVIYDTEKELFYNPENSEVYNIKAHGNYDKMMALLIKNQGAFTSYQDFNELDIYKQTDSRNINKKITDTKDNLQKNVCKNLGLDYGSNKFIEVDKGLRLLI